MSEQEAQGAAAASATAGGEEPKKSMKMTRQTIAAAEYKEEGTKMLKDGNLGKAIFKYQLCRMNVQQNAIQRTKEEVAYDKKKSEEKAKRKAEEEAKRKADLEARRAAGEDIPEEKELSPEEQKAKETQEMAAAMQAQMGGAGGPGGGAGDPMGMLGMMGGGGGGNSSDDEIKLCRILYMASLNNLAHCFLQKDRFTDCIEVTTEAIGFDKTAPKPYYRRGIAWTKKGHAEKGVVDLEKALQLTPGDKGIEEMLSWAKGQIVEQKAKEKQTMAKMFS